MSTLPLHWAPSRLTRRLAIFAAAAIAAAIAMRRPEFLAFAAPVLGALAMGAVRARPAELQVHIEPEDPRCFEGETVLVSVIARAGPNSDGGDVDVKIAASNGVEVIEERRRPLPGGCHLEVRLRADEWGRFAPAVRASVRAAGGLLRSFDTVHPLRLRVYPRAAPMTDPLRAADLPDRIGAHLARRAGEGIEFAGIRPYVPGDQLRTVNWPVSARRGRLHVTERLAERSADIVALIDTYALHTEPGAPAGTRYTRVAIGLAVHGAAQVVQSALRRADRAGIIALGGRVRWLGPDIGRRQFYRVVDAMLDAYPAPGDTGRSPSGHTDFVPRGMMPSGSIVVAFTPLLDGRIALALDDLRLRGYAAVVVDVLREMPRVGTEEVDPLVERMWRLERRTMHRNFALLGIPVVPWVAGTALDEALAPLARRPLAARRPAG